MGGKSGMFRERIFMSVCKLVQIQIKTDVVHVDVVSQGDCLTLGGVI